MKKMSEKEYIDFLKEGTRTAHAATVKRDGSPHVVPIWFEFDGGTLLFTTGKQTVKALNLRNDPRICLSIDDPVPPYAFVKIEGTASTSEDPDELLYWATRIGGRYMGEENADLFGRRNSVPGEILVKVIPDTITAFKDIAGW